MAITTLRPNALDQTIGSVTVVGSGGANGVTANAPADDASYITSDSKGSGVRLGMQDVTISGTQRAKWLRVRLRMFHNSADVGWREYVDVRLRGSVTGKTTPKSTLGTVSDTALEQSTGVWSLDPLGASWTDLGIDRTQVDLAWAARAASPPITQLRVTEVYLDVDVHTQLSITSVTVTGATTTSRPIISWVVTADPDNDAQTVWSAYVYSAAQVAAGGFSPGVSAATWSGSGTGSTSSVTVGKDLQNGVTYQAYVRVGKDWPGPDGPYWYSDWSSSSTFTMLLTPPPTPTIAVTPELTLPGYRARTVVSFPGLNMLDSETGEFVSTIGNWVAGANTNTPTVSATNPKSGTNALLLTATAAGTIEALSGTFASSRRVKPGTVISATASFRALVTARSWQVGIRFFDVSGATISTTMGTGAADTTGGYTTVTLLNQTAPANAFSAVVRVLSASAASAEQHRLDEVGLIIGSTAPWTPGGSMQSGSVTLERSLRVSPTINRAPARNWVHPQVYSAGALTTSTDGFYARQAGDSVVQQILDRAAPESPNNTTAGMIEWQIRVGSFSYLDIGAPDGVATDGMHPYMFPAVPGFSFTGSTWLWASASITVRLGIIFTDAFNTQVGSTTLTSNTVLTTTAQKLSVAATAPAGTVYARLVVEDTLAATGISVFTTQTKWRLSSEPDEAWPGQVFAFVWETVRSSGQTFPQDGRTTMAMYDHEAPPGRPVMYRATLNALTSTGEVMSSAPSVPVHIYMDEPQRALIKDPFQPENAAIVNIWPGDGQSQVEDMSEMHAFGRDGDPVFLRSWRGDDRTIDVSAPSELEWYRLQQLLPSSRPLLVQFTEGGQFYIRIRGWSTARTMIGVYKTISITAAQTARPV